jgi:hypothetical protein
MVAILWDGNIKLFGQLDIQNDIYFSPLKESPKTKRLLIHFGIIEHVSYYYIYRLINQGIKIYCEDNLSYTFVVSDPYALMDFIKYHLVMHKIQEKIITDN